MTLTLKDPEEVFPMTAVGTPKTRMTKDEGRAYLVMKRRARNQLGVDPRPSKFFAQHQPGVFTWTKDYVVFEFYGAGLIRKLRVKMNDVLRANADPGAPWSFAPAERDRPGAAWAQTDGVLTALPGTQHIELRSSKWERAAWNTLNAWCLPLEGAATLWVSAVVVPILRVEKLAELAWARISYADVTTYFLPDPDGTPPGVMTAPPSGSVTEAPAPGYYVARVAMSSTRALVERPMAHLLRRISPEEQQYLAVAWDEYAGTGKPSAQLRGLKRRKSR